MKAQIKNYNVFSIKKGEIVEIQKDNGTYCMCLYNNSVYRIEKRDLIIIKK